MKKAFASWSGGKDACIACYKAMGQGVKIDYLLNTVTEDAVGQRTCGHGLRPELLRAQADAMSIPIIQCPTTKETYEERYKQSIADMKKQGVNTGVFGDIDFNAHREWLDRIAADTGIEAVLPLWLMDQEDILNYFLNAGFESVVVKTKADVLGAEWLGRRLDRDFISEMKRMNLTVCGEEGEYHTFVVNGPLFRNRINITESEKILKDGHWYLDIRGFEIA